MTTLAVLLVLAALYSLLSGFLSRRKQLRRRREYMAMLGLYRRARRNGVDVTWLLEDDKGGPRVYR